MGPVWRGTGGTGAEACGSGIVSICIVTGAWGRVGNAVVDRVGDGMPPEAEMLRGVETEIEGG